MQEQHVKKRLVYDLIIYCQTSHYTSCYS